ncbi:MAG: hypothetical protein AABY22_25300, partial [Nanoarchaeota archaeon]
MNKIALAMICRGTGEELINLRRALESIYKFVDAIYITLTAPKEQLADAEKVCQEFGVVVSYNEALWTADEKVITWLKEFFGYDPHLKAGDNLFLFDEARNFNFSQVPKEYEWIIWMDTDDVFRNGEKLKSTLELGKKGDFEAFYLNYLYQVELAGEFCEECNQKVTVHNRKIKHIIIKHLRERIIRNNG